MTGAGVVLGRVSRTRRALRPDEFAAPVPLALTNGTECRFLCARGTGTRPAIAAFFDWIRKEVAAMEPLSDGPRIVSIHEIPA